MNEILTPIEAGEYLNIHVRTIYRLAKKGMVPARKVGGRWRFSKAALEEWLSEDALKDDNVTNRKGKQETYDEH